MNEYDFLLRDRIQKIKSMNEYDFLLKSYISFSGGKDSTVVHHLMDMALPDNQIPRVYFNTGIEYKAVADYVKRLASHDQRIVIVNSGVKIKQMLDDVGYPFKSKEHSMYLSIYQNSGITKTVKKYLDREDSYKCPSKLRYQFTEDFQLKVSSKCCSKLKKEIAANWMKEHDKTITITGMRAGEGGLRAIHTGCAVYADESCKTLKKFHPLFPLEDWWIDEFIQQNNIELCELYNPPYNFKRTGCVCCPYSVNLQEQLDTLDAYLPAERWRAEYIWNKVYTEYRRIGYRLRMPDLFDQEYLENIKKQCAKNFT